MSEIEVLRERIEAAEKRIGMLENAMRMAAPAKIPADLMAFLAKLGYQPATPIPSMPALQSEAR